MNKGELLFQKERLEKELADVHQQLKDIDNMERPFVANVCTFKRYSHLETSAMQFSTEAAARKKLNEYHAKKSFKLRHNAGVYLYQWIGPNRRKLLEKRDMSPNIKLPSDLENST